MLAKNRSSLRPGLLLALLVTGLASLVYLQTAKYGFVWDDVALITENRDLDSPVPWPFFGQSFTHWWARQGLVPDAYYRPLVITSFWLERKLWGLESSGFHLTNIVLNTIACLLAVIVLKRLFRGFWPMLLGGLAFALHPAHVESVAFVAGRTDVMLTIFVCLAFLALRRYHEHRSTGWLAGAIAAFALGLLSKETAILFPVLGLVRVELGRVGTNRLSADLRRRNFWLPLVLLSGVALLYLVVRSLVLRGVSIGWESVTLLQRILLVLNALGRYVWLASVPFFHRLVYPDLHAFTSLNWSTALALAALAGLVWIVLRVRTPSLRLGALWFLLFILPACNFFPPGPSYVAERLLYLPSLGAVILGVATVHMVGARKIRGLLAGVAGCWVMLAAANTFQWSRVWRNDVTLHTTMVNQNPTSGRARASLGRAFKEQGDRLSALREFRKAVELEPGRAEYRFDLGQLLHAANDLAGAERELRQAVRLGSDLAETHNELGNVLLEQGQALEAIKEYQRAVQLAPQHVMAYNNLGVALLEAGNQTEAEQAFRQALSLDPGLALAHNNLGEILARLGKLDSAINHYQTALVRDPKYGLAHYNLGRAYEARGEFTQAEAEYREAARLMPDYSAVQQDLERLSRRH